MNANILKRTRLNLNQKKRTLNKIILHK